jgi:oxygen-dependent protoporphyrinogen oxidase
VLPRMVEMERRYGSLTRGMLAQRRGVPGNSPRPATEVPARSIFTSLRGGMQQLVDALTATLDADSIRLATPVMGLRREDTGWTVDAGEQPDHFDAVILAAPAWAAAALLSPVDALLGEQLRGIPYSSSIAVNLLYDEEKLGPLPDGFGFLVPASERRAMLACTFAHRKFVGRAPAGKALLRAFLGGIRNEPALNEPDDRILATVRRELREILGINATPEHIHIARWRRAMAQYTVGHQERIARVRERLAGLPGLRLVGNAYDGIGIPDCIRLGRIAATDLMQGV